MSSTQIARALNVDSSQIVKDLSAIDIKGKTRIGYPVAPLEESLRTFLGFDRRHNAVIVGVGSLGSALLSDSGLLRFGLDIVAGFDTNPSVVGTSIHSTPIYPLEELAPVCRSLNAEIGVITVPPNVAQSTASMLCDAGIRALWNFTPFRVVPPPEVVIQNISIYAHLAVMYNRLDQMQGGIGRQ